MNATDPAWRLFVAFIGARRRWAPDGTLRGRAVNAVLRLLADAIDGLYVRFAHVEPGVGPPAPEPQGPAPEPEPEPPPQHFYTTDPRGAVNGPPHGAQVRRFVLLWGWAIDAASQRGPGVHAVRIYLDGVFKGTATYGAPRHDVADPFGNQFLESGWTFALDLEGITAGAHTIQVEALSAISGQATTISHPVDVQPPFPTPTWKKLALFISGCPGEPMRYRCEHAAEQIRLMGGTAECAVHGDVDLGAAIDQYHVFVLHRVLHGDDVAWFVEQARRRGATVIYDVDDLIFDVSIAPHIAALERMTERERDQFLACVIRTREGLLSCDDVFVASEPLCASVAQATGAARARQVPNVVSREMIQQADRALSAHQRSSTSDASGVVRVAYLSGTPTHDRDFREATDALIWALDKFPNLRLITIGPVLLDSRFDRFGQRVEQWALRPWQQLPEALARLDINLAPLERDNPFTEAKSSIKFLEAALVGVPTIASPTADFRRVIVHGTNGFLADTTDEWQNALACLVSSPTQRSAIGSRARSDVLEHHTTAAAAPLLWDGLRQIVGATTRPRLSVNWVASSDATDSFDLARELSARGHDVRTFTLRPDLDDVSYPPADITVATDAAAAHAVAETAQSPARAYLLGADSEHGTSMIERSYGLPLRIIAPDEESERRAHAYSGQRPERLSDASDVAGLERILHAMTLVPLRRQPF
jgi:glycosyltransferase involved in cell wall biosynthesis